MENQKSYNLSDFMQIAEAVLAYVYHDWCEEEFHRVFPGIVNQYMWDERGHDFIKFYNALDNSNSKILMNRIMELRYLKLETQHQ